MKTNCPNCSQYISVPLEYQGETVKCPACKQAFEVPMPEKETNVSMLIAGILSAAAIAGVVGYLCGALLTRVDRKEVEATVVKFETQLEQSSMQLQKANAEVARLKNQLERSSKIIQQANRKKTSLMAIAEKPPTRSVIPKQPEKNIQAPRLGTIQRLNYEVEKNLGSSNRGIAKVQSVEDVDGIVTITFTIDDNLTKGLRKYGAKHDFVKILKAVRSSEYDYSRIIIFGTFTLVDKYGNSEESVVVRAYYTPDIMNKINWPNFLNEDVYKIADWHAAHPEFQDNN